MKKRYASWGSDKSYKWLWRAALQDAIFAFKTRINRKGERGVHNNGLILPSDTDVKSK